MKKRLLSVLLVGLLWLTAAVAVGCGGNNQGAENDELTGSITVAGSTSVQPFSEVLAESFMAQHEGVRINVQGGGSSQGIEAAINGIAEIGSSSRELKEEEKAQLTEYRIATDGIAVIVNPANTVADLSLAQIKDIYTGKITNWKEVGGQDARINVVGREEGSGTREGFESLVMNKEAMTTAALISNSTGSVRTTVAGDANAIGYISLASLDDSVRALKVEGVEASEAAVASGEYKISRPFIYVTKGEATGLAKAFIEFVLSDEGQSILQEEGAVRVK